MHIVVGAPTANVSARSGQTQTRRADFADPDGNTWVIQEIGYSPPHGA